MVRPAQLFFIVCGWI